jgi:plasmid maintenance system antidote protein VapI
MGHLKPVTPGELLREEFLVPMGLTQYRVAKEIGLSNGYWLRAQAAYDIEVAEKELAKALRRIKPWVGTAA